MLAEKWQVKNEKLDFSEPVSLSSYVLGRILRFLRFLLFLIPNSTTGAGQAHTHYDS
jgi:hypothetical protein